MSLTTTGCISTTGSTGTWITGTGTINTTHTTLNTNTWGSIASSYTGSLSRKYKVLGTEIECKTYSGGYGDSFDIALATLNTLGIRFYIELKENSNNILANFPSEIIDFLEKEVIVYNRHDAIEKILN